MALTDAATQYLDLALTITPEVGRWGRVAQQLGDRHRLTLLRVPYLVDCFCLCTYLYWRAF